MTKAAPYIQVRLTRQENATYYGAQVGDTVAVPLEDYVAGVVASEIGNSALEACKAQAVAARTYARPYYSTGRAITDASSTHQAFRAARMDAVMYPHAVQAAKDTAGQVLGYDGRVVDTCVYSASNGGQTVSSVERWGSSRAYLVAKDDPWDAAAGTGRTGHGVGMSQRGAKYAASIGVGYQEILAFYYPGTEIWTEGNMSETVDKILLAAESQLGGPYVFGTWGNECTPSLRRRYADYNPEHEENIRKGCQVLNGSSSSCEGCKWQGRLAFDCRGFTHWCLRQGGITIQGSGATSQYNTAANWMERGEVANMPDVLCCVFKRSGNTMLHTGLHVGHGNIIHCSRGVQRGKITEPGWTHYAVPAGLYTVDELAAARRVERVETLRRGSTGDKVREVQETLKALGYDVGASDGVYGTKTIAAVKEFQAAKGLAVDGVCGTATWAALRQAQEGGDKPTGEQPQGAWDALVEQLRACHGRIQQEMTQLAALIEAVNTQGTQGGNDA